MIYKRFIKRPMDFCLSLAAIIVLSPVIFILVLMIRKKLGSPVLFKQKRPGLNEKVFTLYKFRTMTDQRDDKDQLVKIRQVSTAIIGGLAGIKNH